MNHDVAPKLQAPGAGLPFVQKMMLKLWIGPVVSKRQTPTEIKKNYENLVSKIIHLSEKVPTEKRKIKILVPPMVGLEDSSRYWSLNGALEHLMIVAKNIEKVIIQLSHNNLPQEVADIALVKPKHQEIDCFEEFKNYAPKLLERINFEIELTKGSLESSMKFKHPWFGLMNARQWYWLLNTHQVIHYQQIKKIIEGLSKL